MAGPGVNLTSPWGWAILEGKKLIVYIKLVFFISKKKKKKISQRNRPTYFIYSF
jgi:hypothetical protein